LSWNQDRVTSESAQDINDRMYYKNTDGDGVDVYIIDTGIRTTHEDFNGRAFWGITTVPGSSNEDKSGHGTHVASTVAGKTYGFAKKSLIYAVKVLGDNGSGTNAGVIQGVEWASNQAATKKKPSVGNMSLGGGLSVALDKAVNSATADSLRIVVAAGNDNKDCSLTSPARASDVITVGSTTLGVIDNNIQVDQRSSFSNFGVCVNVFAPGSAITAAWPTTDTSYRTISGTSMASPAVAGIVAVFLGQNPNATQDEVLAHITGTAQSGLISLGCTTASCSASPNLLLHRDC